MNNNTNISFINSRYQAPLVRYARRHLFHKSRAADIVHWVLEELQQEGNLYAGSHLRAILIKRVHSKCLAFNKAVEIASTFRPVNELLNTNNNPGAAK